MFRRRNLLELALLVAGGSMFLALAGLKKLAKANFVCNNKVDQDPLMSNDIEADSNMTWKKLVKQCKDLRDKNRFLSSDNADLRVLNQNQAKN